MKVALFYKKENKQITIKAKAIARQLKVWGIKVIVEKAQGSDLIISIGGDGTLLRTAHKVCKYDIPILGIHLGGLGFLNELEYKNWASGFKKIIKGNYNIDKRYLLRSKIVRKGKVIFNQLGLNDAVINKSGIARVIVFNVALPNIRQVKYLADGLIISSATGSTAYNLSAGGIVLKENSKSLIVTPICPHQLKHSSRICKGLVKVKLKRGESVFVTVDGQSIVPFKLGDTLVVMPNQATCKFIRLNKFDQFKNVKKKLGNRKIVIT